MAWTRESEITMILNWLINIGTPFSQRKVTTTNMCWIARADFPALKREPAKASSSDWLIGPFAPDTRILQHFTGNLSAILYEQYYDIRYFCKIPPKHTISQRRSKNYLLERESNVYSNLHNFNLHFICEWRCRGYSSEKLHRKLIFCIFFILRPKTVIRN